MPVGIRVNPNPLPSVAAAAAPQPQKQKQSDPPKPTPAPKPPSDLDNIVPLTQPLAPQSWQQGKPGKHNVTVRTDGSFEAAVERTGAFYVPASKFNDYKAIQKNPHAKRVILKQQVITFFKWPATWQEAQNDFIGVFHPADLRERSHSRGIWVKGPLPLIDPFHMYTVECVIKEDVWNGKTQQTYHILRSAYQPAPLRVDMLRVMLRDTTSYLPSVVDHVIKTALKAMRRHECYDGELPLNAETLRALSLSDSMMSALIDELAYFNFEHMQKLGWFYNLSKLKGVTPADLAVIMNTLRHDPIKLCFAWLNPVMNIPEIKYKRLVEYNRVFPEKPIDPFVLRAVEFYSEMLAHYLANGHMYAKWSDLCVKYHKVRHDLEQANVIKIKGEPDIEEEAGCMGGDARVSYHVYMYDDRETIEKFVHFVTNIFSKEPTIHALSWMKTVHLWCAFQKRTNKSFIMRTVDEQMRAWAVLTSSATFICVLIGEGGSGKTTTASLVRFAFPPPFTQVCAPHGKASARCVTAFGMGCTIDSLIAQIHKQRLLQGVSDRLPGQVDDYDAYAEDIPNDTEKAKGTGGRYIVRSTSAARNNTRRTNNNGNNKKEKVDPRDRVVEPTPEQLACSEGYDIASLLANDAIVNDRDNKARFCDIQLLTRILFIDEVSTCTMERLMKLIVLLPFVEKVIFTGDSRQMRPVGRGGFLEAWIKKYTGVPSMLINLQHNQRIDPACQALRHALDTFIECSAEHSLALRHAGKGTVDEHAREARRNRMRAFFRRSLVPQNADDTLRPIVILPRPLGSPEELLREIYEFMGNDTSQFQIITQKNRGISPVRKSENTLPQICRHELTELLVYVDPVVRANAERTAQDMGVTGSLQLSAAMLFLGEKILFRKNNKGTQGDLTIHPALRSDAVRNGETDTITKIYDVPISLNSRENVSPRKNTKGPYIEVANYSIGPGGVRIEKPDTNSKTDTWTPPRNSMFLHTKAPNDRGTNRIIELKSGRRVNLRYYPLSNIQRGGVVTTASVQGEEFETSVFWCHSRISDKLRAPELYTGMSRSRNLPVFIGSEEEFFQIMERPAIPLRTPLHHLLPSYESLSAMALQLKIAALIDGFDAEQYAREAAASSQQQQPQQQQEEEEEEEQPLLPSPSPPPSPPPSAVRRASPPSSPPPAPKKLSRKRRIAKVRDLNENEACSLPEDDGDGYQASPTDTPTDTGTTAPAPSTGRKRFKMDDE